MRRSPNLALVAGMGRALISRLPPMRTPCLASPPCDSRGSIQSDRHRALARVYKIALGSGESSSHIFSTISFACVCAQSEPSGSWTSPHRTASCYFGMAWDRCHIGSPLGSSEPSGPSAGRQDANCAGGNPTRVDDSSCPATSFPTHRGVSQGVRKRDFLSDSSARTYKVESSFRLGVYPNALLFAVGDDIGGVGHAAEQPVQL